MKKGGNTMIKQPKTQSATVRRAQLEMALLTLMGTKGYAQTSVTDICREAEIPRRTFYHYFDCKEEVLRAVVENMLSECMLTVMLEFHAGVDAMRASMVRNFRYWQVEGREKLNLLLDNGLSAEMVNCAMSWMERERISLPQRPGVTEKQVEISALIGTSGFFTLLMYWRKNGYRETPEEMADYAVKFLSEPLFQP